MPTTVSLDRLDDGTAILWFDADTAVNTLDAAVMQSLESTLDTLLATAASESISGLILACKKTDCFLAGADLNALAENLDNPQDKVRDRSSYGKQVFAKLAALPCPVVAAISGTCLGGGLELALWVDDRVASDHPKTEIGLPEVKLGLIPGWGGSVRLPRLIGLGEAVRLISSGEALPAEAARKVGLVSAVVPPDKLLAAARAVIAIKNNQTKEQRQLQRDQLRQPIAFADAELGLLSASAHALLSKSLFNKAIAPRRAIDLVIQASQLPEPDAFALESQTLAELYGSAENRALLHVFFADQRLRKIHSVTQAEREAGSPVSSPAIRRVGVIGAGIMGAGIAAANLKQANEVVLLDANDAALRQGAKTAIEIAAYDKSVKRTTKERAIDAAALLTAAESETSLAHADLIVEAVVETLSVKQDLFQKLESQVSPETILASNTSTISVTKIAQPLQRPERCCGLHFFNPVHRMKLVEVIRGEQTSEATIRALTNHVLQLGKKPIVVNDSPGFLVNRLLVPYLNEALEMLCEGASVKQVDAAARNFGMPMGPLQLYDMVGLDTAVKAGLTIWQAYPDRVKASPLLPRLVKLGRLGEKNGLGFYKHTGKSRRPEADPVFEAIQADYLHGKGPNAAELTSEQIAQRLVLPMLLEATRVLDEGIVADPADVDVGVIYGLGFPAFKGGLLGWADQVGVAKLREWVQPWESLGARWEPTERFLAMVESGERFHKNGRFSL